MVNVATLSVHKTSYRLNLGLLMNTELELMQKEAVVFKFEEMKRNLSGRNERKKKPCQDSWCSGRK